MSDSPAGYVPPPEVRQAGGTSIGQLFATAARLYPERTALVEGTRSLSYAALNARVNRLAALLQARGLGHGDRLAILARNSIAFVETELAAAKLGIVTVALNWRLSPGELAHCLDLTEPALLLLQPDYVPVIDGLGGGGSGRLVYDDAYEAALAGGEAAEPRVDVAAEDGLVVIFTSGTTGLPKGALISHRAMVARAMLYAAETQAPAQETFVVWSPLFHMAGNDFALTMLIRGGTAIIVDGYQPQALIEAVRDREIHYLPLIPGMITEFIDEVRAAKVVPRGIGMIGAMADLVPRQQLAEITALLQAPFLNTFGSTETGIAPATGNVIPIGEAPTTLSKRQTRFCEIRLVDPDDREVPDGEPGELAIRGPSVFSGYWRNDQANAESFRNGWFHMGDVFRRNPDGSLDFVDRVKYMIKSGGENIYPAEIEQYILADPRIADAVVVRQPDERWGEVPVVFAARRDAGLTETAVIDACRGRLAGYKLPKAVHFIDFDDFPRSTTGKIQRHELEARLRR